MTYRDLLRWIVRDSHGSSVVAMDYTADFFESLHVVSYRWSVEPVMSTAGVRWKVECPGNDELEPFSYYFDLQDKCWESVAMTSNIEGVFRVFRVFIDTTDHAGWELDQ